MEGGWNVTVVDNFDPYYDRPSNEKTWCLTYSHLYDLCFIALRFFTVYGDGTTRRDYTYVADIVRGIRAAMA
jgi:UDP-glucuronate 4-epimerase